MLALIVLVNLMNDNYLIHYGVLGKEQGIHRYQAKNYANKHNYLVHTGRSKSDGAPVGSGRYKLGSGKRPFQNSPWLKQEKLAKDKPPVSPAERVAKETGNAARSAKEVTESIYRLRKMGKSRNSDTKEMTDAELRNAINRLEMERRYDSLTEDEVGKGWSIASETLGIVGGLAATAASLATVYAVFNSIPK